MYVYRRRVWVVFCVLRFFFRYKVTDYCCSSGFIINYRILKYLNNFRCHNHYTCPCWNLANYISFRSKIIKVIIFYYVIKNSYKFSFFNGKIRKIKNQNPTGISVNIITIDICSGRVFNLNTCYVIKRLRISYNNVLRLANINSSIRSSYCYTVFNQYIFTLYWI